MDMFYVLTETNGQYFTLLAFTVDPLVYTNLWVMRSSNNQKSKYEMNSLNYVEVSSPFKAS